jgi:hypothetical protein
MFVTYFSGIRIRISWRCREPAMCICRPVMHNCLCAVPECQGLQQSVPVHSLFQCLSQFAKHSTVGPPMFIDVCIPQTHAALWWSKGFRELCVCDM